MNAATARTPCLHQRRACRVPPHVVQSGTSARAAWLARAAHPALRVVVLLPFVQVLVLATTDAGMNWWDVARRRAGVLLDLPFAFGDRLAESAQE